MWIITAWQHISTEVTGKCCISNIVNGTDGDMLWNGSAGNGNGRRECEEDEQTDCGGGK